MFYRDFRLISGYCMQMIKKYNFDEIIKEKIKQGKILLGICVGMQVLFEWGMEKGEHQGLGILKGKVVRLQSKYKIPQVGWNKVFFKDTSKIYKPHKNAWFYFVHSYHCIPEDKKIIFASCNYDQKIVSVIQKENLWGTQFHPEKSQQEFFNPICHSLMQPIRIIPCLDIKDAKVIKGQNFLHLKN